MVRKLIKYETIAYTRTMLPMLIILMGMAVLNRFIQLFEAKSTAYNIVFVSSVSVLVITMIVCLVMTVVVGISRFYKNLFTSQGYLSFTLPVTPAQHIFVKSLVSLLFSVVTAVAVFLSVCIATAGEVLVEIFKALGFLLDWFMEMTGTANGVFYIIEMVLVLLASIVSGYMLFYVCIAVGQLAHKNRVLAAFGVYFGYYVFCQILGTIFLIVVTTFYDALPIEEILHYIAEHPTTATHIILLLIFLFYVVQALVYYLITHVIIKKKLNLE